MEKEINEACNIGDFDGVVGESFRICTATAKLQYHVLRNKS